MNDKEQGDKETRKSGKSIKEAIKVSSIPEEYEIVRKRFGEDFEFIRQALAERGDKNFDILTFKDSEGNVHNLYFDISSFYKKWERNDRNK